MEDLRRAAVYDSGDQVFNLDAKRKLDEMPDTCYKPELELAWNRQRSTEVNGKNVNLYPLRIWPYALRLLFL